jgi:hypothetical protein
LYENYNGIPYSKAEDHRKFKAWVGVDPIVCEKIFSKYQNKCLPNRSRLLIVLFYLKHMPTEDEGAAIAYQCKLLVYINYIFG